MSLPHHTQWANHLWGSVSVSHLRQCPLLYFTPAACHLVLSTPSHLSALNPNRPLLSALTLPLFFFFFIKNVFLLFPLVFQIQPFPTITYSSHSTDHSLSSDLSWSFWFEPTVYSPFYLLCPQCLLHCLPLSRWQKHGTLKDPVVSLSLSEVISDKKNLYVPMMQHWRSSWYVLGILYF